MTGAHEGPPWASEAREAVALPYIGRHRPPLARLVEDQPGVIDMGDGPWPGLDAFIDRHEADTFEIREAHFVCVVCTTSRPVSQGRPLTSERFPSWICTDTASCHAAVQELHADDAWPPEDDDGQ